MTLGVNLTTLASGGIASAFSAALSFTTVLASSVYGAVNVGNFHLGGTVNDFMTGKGALKVLGQAAGNFAMSELFSAIKVPNRFGKLMIGAINAAVDHESDTDSAEWVKNFNLGAKLGGVLNLVEIV